MNEVAWILALQAFVCGILGAILIRLVEAGDWRVQRNHQRPFWHSGGPNQGRREGYGILDQGNCDDIYSSCFAF